MILYLFKLFLTSMPELPEVETTIRYLVKKVNGKKILSIKKSKKKLRKNLNLRDLSSVKGNKILEVKRFAKYILLRLSSGSYIIIHLGMSGRLKFYLKDSYKTEKHDHIVLEFEKFFIVYNDPRRFGMFFKLKDHEDLKSFFCNYGQDLLLDKVNISKIIKIFKNKSVSLKQALLDQRILVGLGNIYVNEALFHSRLSPLRLTNSLNDKEIMKLIRSCKYILKLSLKNGGSSINDYKSPDGTLGSFQNMFYVYQRSEVTLKKQSFPVKKITQNGRSTFFSPTLQK